MLQILHLLHLVAAVLPQRFVLVLRLLPGDACHALLLSKAAIRCLLRRTACQNCIQVVHTADTPALQHLR